MVVVKVPKRMAEEVIELARRIGVLDSYREVVREGDFVLIPLSKSVGEIVDRFETVNMELPARVRHPRSVFEVLKDSIPSEFLDGIPRSYDIVGEVAVVNEMNLPQEYWRVFADALMKVHKNVRIVLVKIGCVEGEARVGEYVVVAGRGSTETLHKEHGCVFKVDVTRAFYTPRLSGERHRIAEQVKEGEVVVDMFAGVGPFSIIIAKHKPDTRVCAVEKNPAAYKYLRENIKLNKVDRRVFPYLGDSKNVLSTARFKGIASRVIMNLPSRAFEFLDTAIHVAADNAVIHYYSFAGKTEKETVTRNLENKLLSLGVDYTILATRVVKEVSPSKDMLVYDILVLKKR